MTSKIVLFIMLQSLATFSTALSEEVKLEGEVGAKGVYAGVTGEEGGRAKFTEYRDLQQGVSVFGDVGLGLDSERYFLKFRATDMGYDTQSYRLDGGMWGKFKFDLFYDEIPHNLTFDARTFFFEAGHHALVGTPNTNFSAWNTFDYSIDRKQYGGGFKLPLLKPFYFDVSFQREDRDGIKPAGTAPGSPGGIVLEIPEPVDYTTNNLKLEGGYAKNPFFLSAGFIYSDFDDHNDKLTFTHPVAPFPVDTLTLPPDNKYYKGYFKGAVKLPLNSKFNVNAGYSTAKSDTSLLNSFVDTGTINPITLSKLSFDGKINTKNYSFVLTSNPLRILDGKIFYSFYKRENRNDVVFQNEITLGTIEFNKPFDYKKNAAGIDLGLKLPENFYLSGGYKYIKTDRRLQGIEPTEITDTTEAEQIPPNTKDNIYSADLRWTGLDFLVFKAGYERLDRNADFPTPFVPVNRRSVYSSFDRDTFRTSVDLYPVENLNVGFGYLYKITDYAEIFGLKNDKRHEFESSADYLIGKIAKLYGFFNLEWIKFIQSVQNPSPLNAFSEDTKERTYGFGIGTEVYAIPQKLTFICQFDYEKSNGNVDFTLNPSTFAGAGLGPATGANNDNIDITNLDDYTKYAFKFKAAYHFTKSVIVSAGYVYERFKYNDVQLDNYQFVNPAVGPVAGGNAGYLTGAYKDQSYKAHLIFGGVTYKF
jgi:MtrB/PioB family decaheme-associated outer membrane protein